MRVGCLKEVRVFRYKLVPSLCCIRTMYVVCTVLYLETFDSNIIVLVELSTKSCAISCTYYILAYVRTYLFSRKDIGYIGGSPIYHMVILLCTQSEDSEPIYKHG